MRRLSFLIVFACLLLSWPAVINPGPQPVGWDDAHYLHRASCVTHAIFEPALTGFGDCLKLAVKAPLMAWLGWPWGPWSASADGIGLPLVSLAVLTFGVVVALAEIMLQLAIPPLAILLAFTCVTLNPLLRVVAGGYEGDTLMALLVALLGMLVPLELRRPNPGLCTSIGRGLAWGGVIALGIMAKTSFGFFAAALAPLLLYLRLTRSGWRSALVATLACTVIMAPVAIYHLLYWNEIIGHVRLSLVGPLAEHTSYNLDFTGYLSTLFGRYGSVPMALTAMTAVIGWWLGTKRPAGLWALVWPVLVLVVYIGLTASSQNHDMRYGLPFLVGLPFALAALAASDTPAEGAGPRGLLTIGILMVLLSVPMALRPDLRYVREAQAVLPSLAATALTAAPATEHPFTLLVASDDSAINLDTFLLAQQLDLKRFARLRIETVVYDEAMGRSLAEILARITAADAVVMLKAPISKSPEWTNRHATTIREHLKSLGANRDENASPHLEIYRLNHGDING